MAHRLNSTQVWSRGLNGNSDSTDITVNADNWSNYMYQLINCTVKHHKQNKTYSNIICEFILTYWKERDKEK